MSVPIWSCCTERKRASHHKGARGSPVAFSGKPAEDLMVMEPEALGATPFLRDTMGLQDMAEERSLERPGYGLHVAQSRTGGASTARRQEWREQRTPR